MRGNQSSEEFSFNPPPTGSSALFWAPDSEPGLRMGMWTSFRVWHCENIRLWYLPDGGCCSDSEGDRNRRKVEAYSAIFHEVPC